MIDLEPDEAINKHGLDIEHGNCSSLYVQRGYMDGAELCYRVDKGTPTGRYLCKYPMHTWKYFYFLPMGVNGIICTINNAGNTHKNYGLFSATHFDFSRLSQKNGLCLLVTLLNKLGAIFPYPYYLYHEKLRVMAYPYRCVVTVSCYLSENVGYQMNEPLANLCWGDKNSVS